MISSAPSSVTSDDNRVLDGVEHGVVADAVAPGRSVNLHMPLLYYKKAH
jgi:hypothetical protein